MNLRLRFRRVVLDADTRAGRIYNLVIFGTILASVAGLLVEPTPTWIIAFDQQPDWTNVLERICLGVFIADFLLHLWVTPKPSKYLFSFYGLIDFSAALFFLFPRSAAVSFFGFLNSGESCVCSNCCAFLMKPSCWAMP